MKIRYLNYTFQNIAIIVYFFNDSEVQNQSTRKFSCENSPNQLIENTNEKFLEKKSYRREKEKENKEEFGKINSNETSAKEKHKEKEKICVKLIKEIAEDSITSKLV